MSVPHEWPESVERAEALQRELAPLVDPTTPDGLTVTTAAGLDVAYAEEGDLLVAAVVVLDVASLAVVDSATALAAPAFPYVPGLFAFRELPPLLGALERLSVTPDLLLADGQGLAHPRRFGLACHLGLVTGLPTAGVAKTPMTAHPPPGPNRGDHAPLTDDGGREVGRALRTRSGVKPVYVSVGHRIDLDRACAEVLRLCPRYRLPETTRAADQLCRAALREASHQDRPHQA
nr:endonuclease V [Goodfellowiella coeruleoviolacea]